MGIGPSTDGKIIFLHDEIRPSVVCPSLQVYDVELQAGEVAVVAARSDDEGTRRRLQLHAVAYNLANFRRTLALPVDVEHWSLTMLREKLVKTGAGIVRHARYVVFQLAEVAVPRALFAATMRRMDRLRPEPLPA